MMSGYCCFVLLFKILKATELVVFVPIVISENFAIFCVTLRALDHPILGPKFGPIPNAKKYGFFPIPGKKFPI